MRYRVIATVVFSLSACATSQQAPSPQASSSDSDSASASASEEKGEVKKPKVAKRNLGQSGPKPEDAKKGKIEPESQSGVPLASSPEGMMTPEGASMIRRALIDRGYLNSVEEGHFDTQVARALEKFQQDNELARTGAPDRETLKQLGLDPEDVLRRNKGEGEEKGEG
jgi:hypothetical protein